MLKTKKGKHHMIMLNGMKSERSLRARFFHSFTHMFFVHKKISTSRRQIDSTIGIKIIPICIQIFRDLFDLFHPDQPLTGNQYSYRLLYYIGKNKWNDLSLKSYKKNWLKIIFYVFLLIIEWEKIGKFNGDVQRNTWQEKIVFFQCSGESKLEAKIQSGKQIMDAHELMFCFTTYVNLENISLKTTIWFIIP